MKAADVVGQHSVFGFHAQARRPEGWRDSYEARNEKRSVAATGQHSKEATIPRRVSGQLVAPTLTYAKERYA